MTPELKARLEKMRDESAKRYFHKYLGEPEDFNAGFNAAMPIIEELAGALEFYAEGNHWSGDFDGQSANDDCGNRARAALAKLGAL